MAIEGSLVDVSLADICQLLSLGRKTGCLTITDRSDFGYIYFQNGRVIHASGSLDASEPQPSEKTIFRMAGFVFALTA